jgi:hypothetical protein
LNMTDHIAHPPITEHMHIEITDLNGDFRHRRLEPKSPRSLASVGPPGRRLLSPIQRRFCDGSDPRHTADTRAALFWRGTNDSGPDHNNRRWNSLCSRQTAGRIF